MNNKRKNFFSLPQAKSGKIIAGVIIIIWQLLTVEFSFPASAEAFGFMIVPLAIVVFGVWLIYSGAKQKDIK